MHVSVKAVVVFHVTSSLNRTSNFLSCKLVFTTQRTFGSGKQYTNSPCNWMTVCSTTEHTNFLGSEWNVSAFALELTSLSQEQVDKQIESNIASISKEVEGLTRLIQGITRTHQTSLVATVLLFQQPQPCATKLLS